ncbi:hypothetical protein IWQ47_001268 [Aquimarina sp. EL_43]|nr:MULTISPECIES: hypothetical protein [unclassified Aquimarina]MBG6129429.1 hypothetical protein [Aquimarina sp. EL_35]MBG6150494.1 hypothetical protein [Aquimarina sp. EL_32]MBG6168198.1 hypothetical protein [Aquimarina sp. EL_43]
MKRNSYPTIIKTVLWADVKNLFLLSEKIVISLPPGKKYAFGTSGKGTR